MKKALLFSLGMLFSTLVLGQIIHVPADFSSIQEAINAANPYDTVLVDPGIYYEHIVVPNKALVVGSLFLTTQDKDYIAQTILDGSNNGRVLFFPYTDEPLLVSGFTIQNGQLAGSVSWGAGIAAYTVSNLTLTDLVIKSNIVETGGGGMALVGNSQVNLYNTNFTGNKATGSTILFLNGEGGAMYTGGCTLNCINCTFETNSADLGGAIWCNGGTHLYKMCSFNGNSANYLGEAIASFGGQNSTFEKCSFENHPLGAVFEPWEANINIKNCLIANNKQIITSANTGVDIKIISSTIANNQGGDYSIFLSHDNKFYMANSIFWNSGTIHLYMNNEMSLSHDILDGGLESIYSQGTGNNINSSVYIYDINPYFIDSTDYHLADYSPAIGAGVDSVEMNGIWFYSPATDFENNPRPGPEGSYPDIGAYENILGLPVGIGHPEISDQTQIKIFPNPASTFCMIALPKQYPDETQQLTVNNLKGSIVQELVISPGQTFVRLDVSYYSSGIYSVICRSNGKIIGVSKLVVHQKQ